MKLRKVQLQLVVLVRQSCCCMVNNTPIFLWNQRKIVVAITNMGFFSVTSKHSNTTLDATSRTEHSDLKNWLLKVDKGKLGDLIVVNTPEIIFKT